MYASSQDPVELRSGAPRTPRATHGRVRRDLHRAQESLREHIFAALPDESDLASMNLRPSPTARPRAGSRPQLVLQDDRQRLYLFKLAPSEQISAELLASRLRSLGNRLHVPAARRVLDYPGAPGAVGMVQPLLDVAGALPKDPRQWTALQCEAMLLDHPWEWLLANLDTHVDQFVLVGEHGLPVNIDWDHSLVDLATLTLTRFNRRSLTVMPIRNLLYAEYIAGRVRLDFYGMQLQAHTIAEIPFSEIEALLHRRADELGEPAKERQRVIEAIRSRHRRIARDFDALIEQLRAERYRGSGAPGDSWQRIAAYTQDAWQRFSMRVLHDHVVRPVLWLHRRVLER